MDTVRAKEEACRQQEADLRRREQAVALRERTHQLAPSGGETVGAGGEVETEILKLKIRQLEETQAEVMAADK